MVLVRCFGELYGGANETRFVYDVVGVMNWIEKMVSCHVLLKNHILIRLDC